MWKMGHMRRLTASIMLDGRPAGGPRLSRTWWPAPTRSGLRGRCQLPTHQVGPGGHKGGTAIVPRSTNDLVLSQSTTTEQGGLLSMGRARQGVEAVNWAPRANLPITGWPGVWVSQCRAARGRDARAARRRGRRARAGITGEGRALLHPPWLHVNDASASHMPL